MRHRTGLVALLCTLSLLLVACGGSSAPASGGNTAPADTKPVEKKPITIKMGTGGKTSSVYLQPAVAEFKGFLKDEKVEGTITDFKGGAQAAEALLGGSIDFANMAIDHVVVAKTKNKDLVVLALYTRYTGVSLVVNSKFASQIKTPADLKGHSIGVSSIGSGTHLAAIAILNKFGIKAEEVTFRPVGQGAPFIAAFETGQVDAAVNSDPYITKLITEKKAYMMWDLTQEKDTHDLYGSDYPFTALTTRKDVIAKDPEAVQRVVNAMAKAIKFVAGAKPEEIADALPDEFRPDKTLYVQGLNHAKPSLSPDGMIDKAGVETVINQLKLNKIIPADATIDAASLFDMSYLQKAGK